MTEQRRDVRYPARILARITRRGELVELLTNDVSFRGAFVRTDAPPANRQLIRVTFVLPNNALVSSHAMVVRQVIPSDEGETVPGVGMQFWGAIDGARMWESFVNELKAKMKAGVPQARVADRVRRNSERFRLALEVVVDGKRTTTRDVSFNGMAVKTDLAMSIGMHAQMTVLLPNGSAIVVDVVVRRRIDEPNFRGLGVEFVDVSAETRQALTTALRAYVPSEDAIFIVPGDPKLL